MWRDGAVANAATFVAMQSARGHKHGENKYQQVMKEALEW
jgi:hypothetical protein